jgi:outer membrane protein OmpA-like peptidoglycan-associated protein
MRIYLLPIVFLSFFAFGQKMTGFWQGMLFIPGGNSEKPNIPVYLDIFVSNGMVDGKIRIENNGGASIYPVSGNYADFKMNLFTLKATWSYIPEFSLTPYYYELRYNPKTGYLEGASDKDNYHLILYQSKGEIAALKTPYLPKEWLQRFQQELNDGISAPNIRKEELQRFVFQPIYFDYNKAVIKPEFEPYLKELIRMVKSHSDLRIQITGHTDADGSNAYNLKLSKERAKALLLFFEQNGLPKDRVVIDFKGETQPVDVNNNEQGKQKNRRVDFKFI